MKSKVFFCTVHRYVCRWDQTSQEQIINPPAPYPVLTGFVKVVVLDTYGGPAYVHRIQLKGETWGLSAPAGS